MTSKQLGMTVYQTTVYMIIVYQTTVDDWQTVIVAVYQTTVNVIIVYQTTVDD